jgi:FlaG/FlaF family flagellin (archaellin)
MRALSSKQWVLSLILVALPARVIANQVLVTSSFSPCQQKSNITVTKLDIQYNNDNKTVTFNVAGSSTSTQNVTATLDVTAYGNSVYSNSFNPCDKATFVKQLCPGTYPIEYF